MTSVVRLVDCAEAAAPLPELEAVAGRGLAAVQGTRVLQGNLIQVKGQDDPYDTRDEAAVSSNLT